MSPRLIVNEVSQLEQVSTTENIKHPPVVSWMARFFSVIFHPVFVPLYILLFLLFIHPYAFTGFDTRRKVMALLQGVLMFTFFPLVTTLLLLALKFIESIQLKTQRDRIIPIIASMMWYFWIWYVWKNLPDYPREVVVLAMGVFISSIIALMANIRMKISLHAIAMGILLAFMLGLAMSSSIRFGLYLSVTLFIVGLVCTSRLITNSHAPQEVYAGLGAGVLSILIANWVV